MEHSRQKEVLLVIQRSKAGVTGGCVCEVVGEGAVFLKHSEWECKLQKEQATTGLWEGT